MPDTTFDDRVWHHEMETCEGIREFGTGDCMTAHVRGRMVALGVIPDEGLAS